MQIQSTPQISFKGYDARRLKGFLMNTNHCGIANEMFDIGRKEGFKVFSATDQCYEGIPLYSEFSELSGMWAQDYWTVVKNSILSLKNNFTLEKLKRFFKLETNPVQAEFRRSEAYKQIEKRLKNAPSGLSRTYLDAMEDLKQLNRKTHIPGGNIFIVKGDLADDVIVGENELRKFSIDDIKRMFSTDRVCVLPQMDYHIDLFIRPLDKKRILLADDNKTLEVLKSLINKFDNLSSDLPQSQAVKVPIIKNKINKVYEKFQRQVARNPLPNADEVAKILEENNYEVIRVPGRLYDVCIDFYQGDTLLSHTVNYINANVIKNEAGDLVYITNKSNIDKILGSHIIEDLNISFENSFLESISPYVKREHTYFLKGDNNFVADEMLIRHMGGSHCVCAEIP